MSESPAANSDIPHDRLTVRAVLRTDVGKVRSENQDFGSLSLADGDEATGLMIVADGMGGHRGGATASRLATETVKAQVLGNDAGNIPQILRDALVRANSAIWSESQKNPDLRGMGTTTSALVVRDSKGWFAHVGDSRIYLVRGGEIRQLTDDHSLVASMVREGLITPAEAENHPRRNVLQRSMGVSEEVEIDVRGPIELRERDTFVICSDGLHGVVREEEIKQIATLPIDDAADELVRRALEKGAPDNVTVIVARMERPGGFDPDNTVVDKVDRALFEETIREKNGDRPEPAPVRATSRSISIVKWTLIFVIVLGAAGAGIFWTQQQRFAERTQSSSR
ncbi:MAG TPA: Stp1/IreP family PP2C-type Ser/Thr phosphatase [Thermoanaerobaculia bacterium]